MARFVLLLRPRDQPSEIRHRPSATRPRPVTDGQYLQMRAAEQGVAARTHVARSLP